MPLFFFISRYLTKKRNDIQINIYKYWHSLIIPYFLYNIIFYPYWFIRYFLEHGGVLSFSDMVIKPALESYLVKLKLPFHIQYQE